MHMYLVCQGSSREEEPSPQSHDINKVRPAASDFLHLVFLGHNVQLHFNYCNFFALAQHGPCQFKAYALFLKLKTDISREMETAPGGGFL